MALQYLIYFFNNNDDVTINLFVAGALFLYPLKTLRFSDVFKGWRKSALGTNELKL